MATWTTVLATRARGKPVQLGVELRHNVRFAAPLMLSTLLVALAGFSLHAGSWVHAHDR